MRLAVARDQQRLPAHEQARRRDQRHGSLARAAVDRGVDERRARGRPRPSTWSAWRGRARDPTRARAARPCARRPARRARSPARRARAPGRRASGSSSGRTAGPSASRNTAGRGERPRPASEQECERAGEGEREGQQRELPREGMLAEERDRAGQPVGEHRRHPAESDRRLGRPVPVDLEAVGVAGMRQRLPRELDVDRDRRSRAASRRSPR